MTIQELIKQKESTYKYFTENESLKAVEQDGYALRYVQNQTEEICLKAVEQDGNALQYVQNQTEEICLKAVEQDGYALQYVQETLFKKEPKELTINEISKLLGYEIKIIK
jgi:hypothetical protein